jgi:hypothetical protein
VGSQAAGVTGATSSPSASEEAALVEWRPCHQPPCSAGEGRFLLDRFLGRFCNPFYRISKEEDLYDDTIDQATCEPLSLADFEALHSGAGAPDELQRELASFLADRLAEDCAADLQSLAAGRFSCASGSSTDILEAQWKLLLDPFRPLLSQELERHLIEAAAVRWRLHVPPDIVVRSVDVAHMCAPPALARAKAEHEARFRACVENLRALRRFNQRKNGRSDYSVLIVGAGPAGLVRAISAELQGLPTAVLELRPESAPRRPQIVVIRSKAVITMLERLGVLDFLFKEDKIFPLGRLRLEVSLADLELALCAVLRAVAPDDSALAMHYGVNVVRIDQAGGLARVLASDGRAHLSFSPKLLVIADGRHGRTSGLLGISRREQFHSHTGIIAIFRAGDKGLSRWDRMFGQIVSKLSYAFHRFVSRRGAGLLAGTILQAPGHHYLGLDLARDEEMRLRDAIAGAKKPQAGAENNERDQTAAPPETDELRRMVLFWARYGFEAIRARPQGAAPSTGGRPIPWLPLDPQFATAIEVVSDRADVFCGHIGKTFVMLEGDAQFTIHPGSAYGCTKALLSARLFDLLLRARLSAPDGLSARLSDRVFLYNAELMARDCDRITRLFRVTV